MPRKKAEEEAGTIRGLANIPDAKLIVQKSLPLFSLWNSDLTLAEFKIMDTYLARIDSHHPENRNVRFEKGELENLLGVTQIRQPELEERLSHLMGHIVKVYDPEDSDQADGFTLIVLFEKAHCRKDSSGVWEIELECTQSALRYFFNIEKLGYLRYKLRCVTALSSRYSYILFCYLESNRFRKSWEVPVEELKLILNCDKEQTYAEYRYFNRYILGTCEKEINEKTECHFRYEPVKHGRNVVSIRFTLETIPDYVLDNAEKPVLTEEQEQLAEVSPIDFLSGAIPEFSREQMEKICDVLKKTPESVIGGDPSDELSLRQYSYLKEEFAKLEYREKSFPISNRFAYFLKMLKTNAG